MRKVLIWVVLLVREGVEGFKRCRDRMRGFGGWFEVVGRERGGLMMVLVVWIMDWMCGGIIF